MAAPAAELLVVVIGDAGTGKTSLVAALATGRFPHPVPRLLLPTRALLDPASAPFLVVDTAHMPEDMDLLLLDCNAADVVLLTYDCNRPATLRRLCTVWLPLLQGLQFKAPIIVVGCKLDLRGGRPGNTAQLAMAMRRFPIIDNCIECSALRKIQLSEVLFCAQMAVLHPVAPLFDQDEQCLKPRCVRALKRIFILSDHDMDGALSDVELNDFQVRCFASPLQLAEMEGMKKVVQENMPKGVNDNGLTLTGFIYLHALLIEKGRVDTTWTVLRKFGYDNDIKLRDNLIPMKIECAPDQTLELTNEVFDFLRGIFNTFDIDNDGTLLPADLEDLFSTAPENPWSSDPYKGCAQRNAWGGLSVEGFLSKWALMTLLDPAYSFTQLKYIGYSGDFSSAFTITRKRQVDRQNQKSQRNIFQCFVFGWKGAGKTALLQSFLGRQHSNASPTGSERFSANTVELPDGTKKTLVLQEIFQDDVKPLLQNKEFLAPCDVAVFLYDSSDEFSWQRAKNMLSQVATHGENTGYKIPCLLVASKDDLNKCSLVLSESIKVSQDMGIEKPTPISVRLNGLNNIFCKIVHAAQQPHLSIPETQPDKAPK